MFGWIVRVTGNPQAVLDRQAPAMIFGTPRSPGWAKFAKNFLKGKVCAACGRKDYLNAHHVLAYHTHPELEMVSSNLIPLCEGVNACHYICGHGSTSWEVNTEDPWEMSRKYSALLQLVRGTVA